MQNKVAVIGEAWGRFEEIEGKPFVGQAGQQLESIFKQLGKNRSDFYLDNIINRRPPNNDFSKFDEDEIGCETNNLVGRLCDIVKPSIVILLGANALKSFTGLDSIDKWRGSIIEAYGFKCIATYHPSMLVRGGRTKDGVPVRPIMLMDFKKALRESDSSKIDYLKRNRWVEPTYFDVIDFLEYVQEDIKEVAVDIETEHNQIVCIGIATSKIDSICIPFKNEYGNYWGEQQEKDIKEKINSILANPDIKKIGQNFPFDMTWLEERWLMEINGYEFDTLVGMNVVFPELPQGLAFQTSIFTDIPYYKDNRKEHIKVKDYRKLWQYNCNDVLSTFECYEKLKQEIDYRNLWEQFNFSMDVFKTMHKISRRGIRFDTIKQKEMRKEYKGKIKQIEEEANATVGYTINLRSNKQLQRYIYDEQGIEAIYSRKTGNRTLDENALRKLRVKYPLNSILSSLELYRHLRKVFDNYLSIKLDPDKRIRCSYGLAETGRLTSSGSPYKTGTNLQNIPKQDGRGREFRKLLVPDEDHIFVEVDLSQAEARVVAYDSGDENYIKVFEEGGDVHTRNALNIFGEISPKLRQLGKKVSHATNYGMGPRTMCESIIKELGMEYAITERDAKKFQKAYFEAYPGVKIWQEGIRDKLKQDRTLGNCFGRTRYFLGPWGDSLFREAYAFIPQSTIADLINSIIISWENLLNTKDDFPILLQIHDSVLMQCKLNRLASYLDALRGHFKFPITINNYDIIIPIDIKTGYNWYEMEGI